MDDTFWITRILYYSIGFGFAGYVSEKLRENYRNGLTWLLLMWLWPMWLVALLVASGIHSLAKRFP